MKKLFLLLTAVLLLAVSVNTLAEVRVTHVPRAELIKQMNEKLQKRQTANHSANRAPQYSFSDYDQYRYHFRQGQTAYWYERPNLVTINFVDANSDGIPDDGLAQIEFSDADDTGDYFLLEFHVTRCDAPTTHIPVGYYSVSDSGNPFTATKCIDVNDQKTYPCTAVENGGYCYFITSGTISIGISRGDIIIRGRCKNSNKLYVYFNIGLDPTDGANQTYTNDQQNATSFVFTTDQATLTQNGANNLLLKAEKTVNSGSYNTSYYSALKFVVPSAAYSDQYIPSGSYDIASSGSNYVAKSTGSVSSYLPSPSAMKITYSDDTGNPLYFFPYCGKALVVNPNQTKIPMYVRMDDANTYGFGQRVLVGEMPALYQITMGTPSNGSNTLSSKEGHGYPEGGILYGLSGNYYYAGTILTLTPVANPGYEFDSWTGASPVDNGDGTYTLTVSSSATITANFRASGATYTVNYGVNINAGGSITTHTYGSPATNFASGKNDFASGTSVTLTATANPGYRFDKWSNNVTTPTITFNISKDTTLTAQFIKTYVITATCGAEGYTTGSDTYDVNGVATLTAISNNEHLYFFDHWETGGETYPGGATITPTVTGDATYTAVFRVASNGTITATASPSDYGSATVSQSSTNGGTAVTLTATPKTCYAFTGWDDNNDGIVDNTDNSRTVYVDGDKAYIAMFVVEAPSYYAYQWGVDDIRTQKWGDNNFNSDWSNWVYNDCDFVRVDARNSSDKAMRLMFWVTDFSNTYNGYMGPAEGDYIIYEPDYNYEYYGWGISDEYLDAAVIGHNTSSGIGSYSYGNTQAWAGDQPRYISWLGNMTAMNTISNTSGFPIGSTVHVERGLNDNMYIRVTNPSGVLIATIGAPAPTTHTVSITAPTNGTITVSYNDGSAQSFTSGSRDIAENTVLTVTTTPATGYHFDSWTNDGAASVTVNGNKTIGATFAANTYQVSFAANGGSGTMTNQNFTYGVAQNLKANTFTAPTATATYNFNGATGGNSPASETVHALFSNWTDGVNNYADEAEVNNLTATNGATVAMTANWSWTEEITLPTPTKTGYTFHDWTFTMGGMNMSEDAGAEIAIEENVSMTANWDIVTYNLTYEGLEGATNTNPATYTVESETITLVNPGTRDGYTFTGWTCDGETITEITHGSTGDKTLTATWNAATTLDLYDDQDATYYNNIKALNGKTYDVTYHRSTAYTSDNGNARWYTLCLPFNVDQSQLDLNGLTGKVYEYRYAEGSADENDHVTFHFRAVKSPNYMLAGQGYLVKATSTMPSEYTFANVTLNTATDVADGDVNDLKETNAYKESGKIAIVGVLRNGTLHAVGKQVMGLANNKIWYPHSSGNPMPAYRAYFYNPDAPDTAPMPRVRIVVEGEGETELEVVDEELYDAGGEDRAPRKYIRNGVLIIERNGVRYDAQGKRL